MPRLPGDDPEPPLRKVRERVMVLGAGIFTVKTGYIVVRDPRQAAEIRERQRDAIRELLDWHGNGALEDSGDLGRRGNAVPGLVVEDLDVERVEQRLLDLAWCLA
jgi:hypothetical protein